MKLSVEERWISFVEVLDNDCWRWTGSRTTQGYGQFNLNGKKMCAHQIGWQLSGKSGCRGNQVLLKICKTDLCVNPDHWEKGSRADTLRGCRGKI